MTKTPNEADAKILSALESIESVDHITRLERIHPDLPLLITAVIGGSVSQELYDAAQAHMSAEAHVRGRSGQKITEDEAEAELSFEENSQEEYIRPNGDIYYPRKWGGKEDVAVLRQARKDNFFPLLYGPPGTGKTALAEAAFGEELITVIMTGDTEVHDLVGSYVPARGGGEGFEWIDGPLLVAAREGRPILLDEVGLGDPKVLSVVYGLMDGRREMTVTSNPSIGVVKAEPGFFVMGATNPNAPGVRLSEALLSRFALHVEVTTDFGLAVQLGVPSKLVTVAENLSKKVDEGILTWAPQFRELIAFRNIAKVYGNEWAVQNLLAQVPESDRPDVVEVFAKVYGSQVLPARI